MTSAFKLNWLPHQETKRVHLGMPPPRQVFPVAFLVPASDLFLALPARDNGTGREVFVFLSYSPGDLNGKELSFER